MARINIEDKFWIEVMPLVLALADQDRAIGHAVRFFRMAQEKHRDGKLITEAEFSKMGFTEALFGIFAERVEGGIKCVGAEKYFDWLTKKVEAGRKGGRSKSEAKTKHLKQNRSKTTEANRSKTEASPSISISSSISSSCSLEVPAPALPSTTAEKELRAKIWESYSNAYFSRYQTEPVRNATVNSQISSLAKRLGEEAIEVVGFYVGLGNAFYVRSMHPIGLCLKDAEGLRTQWATGTTMTAREAASADDSMALASQLKRIREGKL